jgi:UDP-GlcNAc:undecaprenyl-phosphate GlcNAc-1-phosphate transferase
VIPPPPKTAVAAFILALLMAGLLTPNLRRFAESRGLLDHPNDSRKVHLRGIPRIGGIGIIAAFYAPLIGLLFYETGLGQLFYERGLTAYPFLAGGLVIAALGVYDDLRGAGAPLKFGVQFTVAAGLYFCGYRIEQISLPGGALDLGMAALPFTLLWIVGIVNAMNLIDGLDGLAGGVALCAVLTNLVVAWVRPEPVMILCMAALGGALLGFLFYNLNPASIFMGDSGSLFLGYVLAASSIATNQKASTAVSMLVPVLALALPITDTLIAMGRRALAGRPMFSGDKEHIHHKLLRVGFSHRNAVLLLSGTSFLLCVIALALSFAQGAVVACVLLVLSAVAFLALRRIGLLRIESGLLQLRHRNRDLRAAVGAIAHKLGTATTVAAILESAETFGPAVSAFSVRLEVAPPAGIAAAAFATHWLSSAERNGHPALWARFEMPEERGTLEVEWADGRGEIDRDHELAAEALCKNVAHAMQRLSSPRAGWLEPIRLPMQAVLQAWPLSRGKARRDPPG